MKNAVAFFHAKAHSLIAKVSISAKLANTAQQAISLLLGS